jgi:phosphatidylglycerophosphate synthase
MKVLQYDYLSKRMLKGLSSYKYSASGHTWLDDLHNPMWNWIVQNLFPLWLAPNLVTLSGLAMIFVSHDLLISYAPGLDGENAPWWVHLFAGLSIIIYINLDCMDGKQARRTKTSSPLGQLFDHGCDALATGLIITNVGTSVSLPLSPTMVLMLFAPLTLWILGQWEEYHTGVHPIVLVLRVVQHSVRVAH